MQILDRYIGRSVLWSTFITLTVLLTLFTFFAFMDEVGDIGKGNYGTWQAVQYVLLTVPKLAYQLFPVAALIGCTIGLGVLASNSELTVMRAAGVSLGRIVWSVMKVGLLIVIVSLVIGEGIAPVAEERAQTLRSVAKSDKLDLGGRSGFWARDGDSFVNVRNFLPGKRLGGVTLYTFDGEQQLTRMLYAESAVYQDGRWMLENITSSEVSFEGVTVQRIDTESWNTRLSPDLLSVVTVKPNTLSIMGLYDYVSYLRENGLDAAVYEQALWGKAVAPLVTGVMVFLAIPFVFGPLRSVSIGHRILVGTLVGIGFHLLNQMFGYLGLVVGIYPALTAVLPLVLALGTGFWLMRRIY